MVPRGGIEPPTRGFLISYDISWYSSLVNKKNNRLRRSTVSNLRSEWFLLACFGTNLVHYLGLKILKVYAVERM
jgi:hypothetical protein